MNILTDPVVSTRILPRSIYPIQNRNTLLRDINGWIKLDLDGINDQKAEDKKDTCTICTINQVCVMFRPCRDATMCKGCFNDLERIAWETRIQHDPSFQAKCPLCRAVIGEAIGVRVQGRPSA